MINLGLTRIADLLKYAHNPQQFLKVFHVAGTNGKGSVCTYIESILSRSGRSTGKFTSPYLIAPNDAIQIKRTPIDSSEYRQLSKYFEKLSVDNNINATEFEIQTAVAFKAFADHSVDVAIIEVGLGGREDATNILDPANILCSSITKVSIDHENFLGTSLESIASHKAGIIKPGVPCVVDGSNDPEVLAVVKDTCTELQAPLKVAHAAHHDDNEPAFRLQNQAVAVNSIKAAFPDISDSVIEEGIDQAYWPGRLQWINENTLVDGAHNVDAAHVLRKFVDAQNRPVRWVLAFSKPAAPILDILIHPGDEVIATEFDPVEGMPWIKSQPAKSITEHVNNLQDVQTSQIEDVSTLVEDPTKLTIVGGSLYLVGQYLGKLSKH